MPRSQNSWQRPLAQTDDFTNQIRSRDVAPFCRDRGRGGVDAGALCLPYPRAGAMRWLDPTLTNRLATRTSTRPPPVSASTPCPYSFGANGLYNYSIRLSKFIYFITYGRPGSFSLAFPLILRYNLIRACLLASTVGTLASPLSHTR